MQSTRANRKKASWGDKPCDHPNLDKEYMNGMATGDYVCTTCGETRWGSSWNKEELEKSKPSSSK